MPSLKVRRAVWERDGGVCGICGLPTPWEETETDHIVPRSRGGTHDPSNLRPTHRTCNVVKAARLPGYVTPKQAAKHLGVDVLTVYRRMAAGKIHAEWSIAPGWGRALIPESELERLTQLSMQKY